MGADGVAASDPTNETRDEADLAAELAALPHETLGVVVVRDVALVSNLVGALEASLPGASSNQAESGTTGDAAASNVPAPSGTGATAARGPAALKDVSAALLGIRWPERRGAIVSWTGSTLRLTLPAEELLAVDPLVVAIGGTQSTAQSACSMSNLRHAWVTCTLPLGEGRGDEPKPSVAFAGGAGSGTALRDAIFDLALDERALDGRVFGETTKVTPSLRMAWRVAGGASIARARVVLDAVNTRVDVVLPDSLATAIVPCSARVPTLLAAVGEERSFAWWSVDPEDVREVIDGLPSPLARAARSWTGESLVVAAEAPHRTEFVFAIEEPGPILGAFGLVSLAGAFGVDVRTLLPGWTLEVEQVSAFAQRFEVLSLSRGAVALSDPAQTDAASWEDARLAFATPTVDALWVGLGVSLQDLAASPDSARNALRLERGATLARLPSRAKLDLAAGTVSALASLDVMTLLEPRAITAARRSWRVVDASSERAWGDTVANLAVPLRARLPESTRLVVWSREVGPSSSGERRAPVDPGSTASGAATTLASPAAPRAVHLHVELCSSCGEGDVAVAKRDWQTPTRALAAIVGSYVATLAVTRRTGP